jgi:glutamate--cysteine ligase
MNPDRKSLGRRLARLREARPDGYLAGGLVGLEKEGLRVVADGTIAQSAHPEGLGAALTHEHITTDYSEALVELITPPFGDVRETLAFLHDLHAYVYAHLGDELLWATSMPCRVGGDESIPIARYGRSNVGMMKHVYRRGLGYRYGRIMQTIAGVHFNYSLPDAFWAPFAEVEGAAAADATFVADAYFRLIRNFHRLGWLVSFLFGSSPAVCKSFLGRDAGDFSEFDAGTWHQPFATSLRMSDIGYKNENQAGLAISYDDLGGYVRSLTRAIETPFQAYEEIGLVVDGEHRQLNTNVLQIENEYYSFIRPKQVAHSGEKPTLALWRRGVQYVEVRALDVGAFDPMGVNEDQLRFVEAFLLLCLLTDSPTIDAAERSLIEDNQRRVALAGRDPELVLNSPDGPRAVREWAAEICRNLEGVCEALDTDQPDGPYGRSLRRQQRAVEDPDRLPSSRIVAEMHDRDESFFQFAMRMSREHLDRFRETGLGPERFEELTAEARRSFERQAAIEAGDRISFEDYLAGYFAQTLDPTERRIA